MRRPLLHSSLLPVVLAVAVAPARAQDRVSAERDPMVGRVVEVLEGLRTGELAAGDVRRELTALGPGAAGAIYALRVGHVVLDEERGPLLDRRAERLLVDVLRAWPAERVGREIVGAMDPEATIHEDLAAVRLLGEVGDLRALGVLFESLGRKDVNWLGFPELERAVEAAVTGVLQRDPRAISEVRAHLRRTHPALLAGVTRALAALRSDDAVPALIDLLNRSPELDVVVLQGLGNVGPLELARADGTRAGVLRGYLDHPDRDVRTQACASLAQLRDGEALEGLVDLLEDPDRAVQAAALRACRDLSRLRWPADARRWRRWCEAETRWLDREAPSLGRLARNGDPAQAVAAIRELSEHQVHGRALVPHLAAAFDHPSERVVLAALAGFARLGEPAGAPTLIELLLDPRSDVRQSAHGTLRSLTGVDLPAEVDAWYAWLDG